MNTNSIDFKTCFEAHVEGRVGRLRRTPTDIKSSRSPGGAATGRRKTSTRATLYKVFNVGLYCPTDKFYKHDHSEAKPTFEGWCAAPGPLWASNPMPSLRHLVNPKAAPRPNLRRGQCCRSLGSKALLNCAQGGLFFHSATPKDHIQSHKNLI